MPKTDASNSCPCSRPLHEELQDSGRDPGRSRPLFLRKYSAKTGSILKMIPRWSRRSALVTVAAAVALLAMRPALLRAQVSGSSIAQTAVGSLTGEQ